MNKFDTILIESSLLFNINPFQTMTIDDFIEKEKNNGNMMHSAPKKQKKKRKLTEAVTDAEVSPIDIDELKQKKLEPLTKGVDIAKRPEKMLHKSNIVDENGNLINNEELMKKIMQRPSVIISQNEKLAKSGFEQQTVYDLTLPSYMGLYVDEANKEFKVVKTCPSAGECSKFCYAAKGGYIMFPSSSMSASRVVNYLMNDPEGFKNQILSELKSAQNRAAKKGKTVTLRWHDSGDFLSEQYLNLAYAIAKETPSVLHYAYTKQVPLVKKMEQYQPDNFVFNFSFGGAHDEQINPMVDKHSRVVPRSLFVDLPHKKTEDKIEFTPAGIDMLKTRVANAYKVDKNSVITYDELESLPFNKGKKWNVLVWKGHGDDAATRKDVLGTYLLFH